MCRRKRRDVNNGLFWGVSERRQMPRRQALWKGCGRMNRQRTSYQIQRDVSESLRDRAKEAERETLKVQREIAALHVENERLRRQNANLARTRERAIQALGMDTVERWESGGEE